MIKEEKSERLQNTTDPGEKVIRIKEEKKEYNGVRYVLVLCAVDGGDPEVDPDKKNDDRWWCIEYDKRDEKWAMRAFRGFLYYDSRFMTGYRVKDKYHHCELVAMSMINKLLDDHVLGRVKWIRKELWAFVYLEFRIGYKQVWHKIRKRIFRDNKMEEAMAKQIKK